MPSPAHAILPDLPDRPDLADLDTATLQHLQAVMEPSWPEVWAELATSVYISLLAVQGRGNLPALARQACAVTLGIAQDIGGRQPYIPVGSSVAASAKMRRVIHMLTVERKGYRQVASATGLTEGRIRQIESAWRKEEVARRQGTLDI